MLYFGLGAFLVLGIIFFVYFNFSTARKIAFAKVSYQQGITALSNSDYASAQNYFASAARADQKNSAYLWQLAITQTKNVKYLDAIKSYTKLIQLLPGRSIIYIQRGSVNQMAGNFEAAKEDFNEAVILDKHNVTAYLSLASLLNTNGNKAEAMAVLNNGILINPDNQLITQAIAAYGNK